MPDIKLIAIDLDGTLVHDARRIPERNLRALQMVMDQGVTVAIATGRMHASARDTSTGDRQAAQVRLGDETIFETAGGLPEAQRAAERLTRLILSGAEMRDVAVAPDGVTVTIRGERVLSVTPDDAALEGRPAAEVAQASARKIANALWSAFVEQVF